MSTFVVKTLDHAKLLTDPFKLKLLEQFADGPITTKQVADAMGEKAPRLYRHVEALADAGFLELVTEKKKRGTVERYFKTTANRFEMDPDLFATVDAAADETSTMLREIFRDTLAELTDTLHEHGVAALGDEHAGIASRLRIKASAEDIADLRTRLWEWLESIQAREDDRTDGEDEHWAGLIVFYPVSKE